MRQLFLLPDAIRRDPAVERWTMEHQDEPGSVACFWLGVLRRCGDDVRELLHDGRPTFCVASAAFAYVDVFRDHANVGFFMGAELADPARLLEGTGRMMRHVKLWSKRAVDEEALATLIVAAYLDMKERVE